MRPRGVRSVRGVAAVVVGTIIFAGCNDFGGQRRICTLIGCNNSLTVEVTGATLRPITVEIHQPGSTQRYSQECTSPSPCLFVFEMTPPQVIVQVTTSAGSRTEQFGPTYVTRRPNGEGCDPECRSATVSIAAP